MAYFCVLRSAVSSAYLLPPDALAWKLYAAYGPLSIPVYADIEVASWLERCQRCGFGADR